MRRSLFIILVLTFFAGTAANAQGLLKKVGKAMSDELVGKSPSTDAKKSEQPEPACACDKAEMVMDMGGKLQLDYKELRISITNDGRVLARHNWNDEYYIIKDGVTQGPYKAEDPRIKSFEVISEEVPEDEDPWTYNYKQYISKKGDKYLISFGGKTYGPYSQIQNFVVTMSKDKFAALIVENVVVTEDQSDAMEEAMKNAKTDQERMDMALKYSSEIQQKIMEGGGTNSMMPKLVSNIAGISYDWTNSMGGTLNNTMKYDDIFMIYGLDIRDLKGNTIHTFNIEQLGGDFFISSDNSKYAWHQYGTLNISDKTKLSELFNPHLIKAEGKIYLAYMYYSPKKNAIMQCKIPF